MPVVDLLANMHGRSECGLGRYSRQIERFQPGDRAACSKIKMNAEKFEVAIAFRTRRQGMYQMSP
jgi:hypothetical protein